MPIPSLFFCFFLCVVVLISGCSRQVVKNNLTKASSAPTKVVKKKRSSFSKNIEAPLVGNVHADLCKIFAQKPSWYRSALKSQKKWRIPIHVMMTIVKQESAFQAKARPPQRKKTNLFGKKHRPSSAYGYAQAQNGTWKDYQKSTKKFTYRRDVFDHAIYFVGWYASQARRVLKLKSDDTYNLYLSYHEGLTGFRLKTYKKKPWLVKVAKKVRNYGYKYAKQLKKCSSQLKRNKGNSQAFLVAANNAQKTVKKAKKNRKINKKIKTASKKPESSFFNTAPKGCSKILGLWPLCAPFQR